VLTALAVEPIELLGKSIGPFAGCDRAEQNGPEASRVLEKRHAFDQKRRRDVGNGGRAVGDAVNENEPNCPAAPGQDRHADEGGNQLGAKPDSGQSRCQSGAVEH